MHAALIVQFTHGQFALVDDDSSGEPGDLGSEAASRDLVVPSEDQREVTILTARYARYAKVIVDVLDAPPAGDFARADQVVECNLNVPTGIIRIVTTEGFDHALLETRECVDWELALPPGIYRMRVLFFNLASMRQRISQADGDEDCRLFYGGKETPTDEELDQMDHYHLQLWPLARAEVEVLKRCAP